MPAAVLLFYIVLACWMTWPLAAHLGTKRPVTFPAGHFDPLYSAWALAWESHALTGGQFALADANIYHPARAALFYGPSVFGALPLFAPVYLLSGNPILALNVLLLASIALCATTAHLVVRAWTGLHSAGLVAAGTLLTNRWLLLTFVPTAPHLAVLFYFPIIIYLSAAPELPLRRAALLFLVTVLQCLTDFAYVAPAVLAPLGVSAALSLMRPSTRRRGLRLALIVMLAAVTVAALHLPYMHIAAENPRLTRQTLWTGDLRRVTPLPGGLLGALSPLAVPTVSLALMAAAAALVLLRGFRGAPREATAARHAALWIVVGLLISLPRYASVGDYVFALPHLAALDRWEMAGVLRVPERLRVAALMGLAMLCGLASATLMRQVRVDRPTIRAFARPALAVLVCLIMYAQYRFAVGQPAAYGGELVTRYYLVPPPRTDSEVLALLRNNGGPTLEVPLPSQRLRDASAHAPAMFRSIVHRQPLLNGYSSYWPAEFTRRMSVAARLPDRNAVRALRGSTGLAYVLARLQPMESIDASLERERAVWRELARTGGRPDLQLVARDDDFALFRVGP